MTPADHLRRLAEAATPGPWEIEREELDTSFSDEEQEQAFPVRVGPFNLAPEGGLVDPDEAAQLERDAAYLAALSPEVVLALLDVAEAARKMSARLDNGYLVCGQCRATAHPGERIAHTPWCRLGAALAALDGAP
jgi:hypothetical protein